MITLVDLKRLFQKDSKTICLAIGGFYVVMGGFSLLSLRLQTIMLSNVESSQDEPFTQHLGALSEIWMVYMPLLTILGLGYLTFGFLFNRMKAGRYQINLLLSILCLIWVIAYAISCIRYIDIFLSGISNDFETYIVYGFAAFGFVAGFASMTVPQYVIGKRIKSFLR